MRDSQRGTRNNQLLKPWRRSRDKRRSGSRAVELQVDIRTTLPALFFPSSSLLVGNISFAWLTLRALCCQDKASRARSAKGLLSPSVAQAYSCTLAQIRILHAFITDRPLTLQWLDRCQPCVTPSIATADNAYTFSSGLASAEEPQPRRTYILLLRFPPLQIADTSSLPLK